MVELSQAAQTLSRHADELDDPLLLMAAVHLLLLSGATLEPDDPWHAYGLLEAAGRTATTQTARLRASARGIIAGPTRHDVQLLPGEQEHFALNFTMNEYAIIEVRLRGGSPGADIDLLVHDADGAIVVSDEGPGTGIEGYGAYVEWLPASCDTVTATIVNKGTETATIVFLAPPAQVSICAP